uniref:C-type lectin domain-containing protein n=1 Tax=Arion vulgaris TaxID=1028688 RepID=A0A0B7A018_9EUPU
MTKMFLQFTVLIVVYLLSDYNISATDDCPEDWYAYKKNCYFFDKVNSRWSVAQVTCRDFGSKLTDILTIEENMFLTKHARRIKFGSAWVGGRDALANGTWKWEAQNTLITFQQWKGGAARQDAAATCLALQTEDKSTYHWKKQGCEIKNRFICKKPRTTATGGDTAAGDPAASDPAASEPATDSKRRNY